jgi:ubiquinol-cytochrome c reductase iron-sulfur subunit
MSSDKKEVDCGRRNLVFATAAVGGVATVATAVPFLASMAPSERAKAAGAPVEADIGKLAPGEMMRGRMARQAGVDPAPHPGNARVAWKKVADQVADPDSKRPMQPDYIKGEARSIKPEYLVVVGICTHLGCSPTDKFKTGADSGIDRLAGRLSLPLPRLDLRPVRPRLQEQAGADNLEVPPHYYLSDSRILIGEDKKA